MESRANNTPEDEFNWIIQAKAGDEAAKVSLIERYGAFIGGCAKRLRVANVEYQERRQMVMLSFLRAINEYDIGSLAAFKTFIHFAVWRHAICQAMPYVRQAKLLFSDELELQDDGAARTIERREAFTFVEKLLSKMPREEAIALRMKLQGKNLWDIADVLDVSKQRANQIWHSALERAKRWAENRPGLLE